MYRNNFLLITAIAASIFLQVASTSEESPRPRDSPECDIEQICGVPDISTVVLDGPANTTESSLRDQCRALQNYSLCYSKLLMHCSPPMPASYMSAVKSLQELASSIVSQWTLCDHPNLPEKVQVLQPCMRNILTLGDRETHNAMAQCFEATGTAIFATLPQSDALSSAPNVTAALHSSCRIVTSTTKCLGAVIVAKRLCDPQALELLLQATEYVLNAFGCGELLQG